MLKFDVHREATDRDRGMTEAWTVETWIDAAEVFSVRADADPEWSVLTFRPGAGPRSLIVWGEADTVAAAISAEVAGRRRRVRRSAAVAVHPGTPD